MRELRRRSPSAPLQPLVAQLVATVMLLAPGVRPAPAAAHPEPTAVAAQPTAPAPPRPVDGITALLDAWRSGAAEVDLAAVEAVGYPVHVVQRFESLARIAGEQLGDEVRWRDLWALNRGSRQPADAGVQDRPVSVAASREYRSAGETDDHRVVRLFEALPELVSVLVARDFVALSLRHPDLWPELLVTALTTVNEEFSAGAAVPSAPTGPGMATMHAGAPPPAAGGRRDTRLYRAWRELGDPRATEPEDQARLLAAATSADTASRQVAGALLMDASADVAQAAWSQLVDDPSRTVRRAAVDANVDAGREELRPLLETALGDADAWVRWKALRGLAELGGEPSRLVVEAARRGLPTSAFGSRLSPYSGADRGRRPGEPVDASPSGVASRYADFPAAAGRTASTPASAPPRAS